jgi:hypothetical protein
MFLVNCFASILIMYVFGNLKKRGVCSTFVVDSSGNEPHSSSPCFFPPPDFKSARAQFHTIYPYHRRPWPALVDRRLLPRRPVAAIRPAGKIEFPSSPRPVIDIDFWLISPVQRGSIQVNRKWVPRRLTKFSFGPTLRTAIIWRNSFKRFAVTYVVLDLLSWWSWMLL